MGGEKESTPAWSRSDVRKPIGTYHQLETPIGLKWLTGSNSTLDFSGFENENRGTTRMLGNAEKEVRFMIELWEGMMMK